MARLIGLVRKIKAISGRDIGVSISVARRMPVAELEEKIREFGHWHKNHCEAVSQEVEQAIYEGLDDEAAKIILAAGHAVLACGEVPLGASVKQEPFCVGGLLAT